MEGELGGRGILNELPLLSREGVIVDGSPAGDARDVADAPVGAAGGAPPPPAMGTADDGMALLLLLPVAMVEVVNCQAAAGMVGRKRMP